MIVITRPDHCSEEFADLLRPLGYKCLIHPFLEIIPIPFENPDFSIYDACVFTSANGVREFVKRCSERPNKTFVVGPQTKEIAQAEGFENITAGKGTALDIIPLLKKHNLPCLHIRGQDVTQQLGIDSIIVYQALQVPMLNPYLEKKIREQEIDAITLFSKRTAQQFCHLMKAQGLEIALKSTKILCLSDSVVECLQDLDITQTHVAKTPDREGMFELVKEHVEVSS